MNRNTLLLLIASWTLIGIIALISYHVSIAPTLSTLNDALSTRTIQLEQVMND